MKIVKYQDLAVLLLRVALAAGFLSSVASRLGLWGTYSSGWENFIKRTGELNSFAPAGIVPFLAISATVLETAFGILLLIGLKTRYAAVGSSLLTLLFALTMTFSTSIKAPLDYSVFVFSASAFLLATVQKYRWSLDEKIDEYKTKGENTKTEWRQGEYTICTERARIGR